MKAGEPSGDPLPRRRQLSAIFYLSRWLPGVTLGLIVGVIEVILAVSFGALIFAGPLAPFVGSGIGLALAGATLGILVIGFRTSLPGTVSGNQDIPAVVIAVTAAGIAGTMSAAGGRATFVTVVVAIALTTVLTGLFLYGLGHSRLGNLVRFLPYPVVGGFLAGTGWLLLTGALGIMVDSVPPLSELSRLFQPEQLLRWLPGVLLAILILIVLNRTDHVLALPALILGAAALFFIVVALSGSNVAAASAGGWLLGPLPAGRLWPPLALAELNQVYWPALPRQVVNVITIWLLSAIALLLNESALELATGEEVDLDRELRAAGIGNIAAGLLGGIVGYQQLSLSVMSIKLGGNNRVAVVAAASLCLLVLFFGGTLLSLFPKVVLGGLLFFLGLSLVLEWAVQTWFTFPLVDYLIVLLILLVTATVGFLEAVGVGLLVAIALFVVNYSRIEVVRDERSGSHFQSRKTWRPAQRQLLHAHGDQLHIVRLQGYIFFGTTDRLYEQIRRRLERPQPPRYLILDFQHVTGIDFTALSTFDRIHQLARTQGVTLILTGVSKAIRRKLTNGEAVNETVPIFPDLDQGCEWCERSLLASLAGPGAATEENALQLELLRVLGDKELVAKLLTYFERQTVAAGDYLMQQGEAPDALYLIESGQITAQLESDAAKIRLQTMEGGHVLGELGFFLGTARTASVVADTPCVVYRLSQEALDQMEARAPGIAAAFHHLIIHLLGERVVHLVTAMNTMQQ